MYIGKFVTKLYIVKLFTKMYIGKFATKLYKVNLLTNCVLVSL